MGFNQRSDTFDYLFGQFEEHMESFDAARLALACVTNPRAMAEVFEEVAAVKVAERIIGDGKCKVCGSELQSDLRCAWGHDW